MKKFSFGILMLLFAQIVNAQITFQKTYGGYGWSGSPLQITNGGYIIPGVTSSFGFDFLLIKTDLVGDTVWMKSFGGTGLEDAYGFQQTADSGYIILGYTGSFGMGVMDIYLVKTDSGGNLLWSKTYGGTDSDLGMSVQQTMDGGYILTGWTHNFPVTGDNVYLIKTDSTGDSLWARTYYGGIHGGAYSVQETADSGYIITGFTASPSLEDAFLIKTNTNGDVIWAKTYGGAGGDRGSSVLQTTDGGFIISGRTQSFGAGDFDVYVIKTDANGDTLWTKAFGGANNDFGYCIRQTTDGGYIVSGTTESFGAGLNDVYLVKTDSGGNLLWSKTFGDTTNESGTSVLQTADGGYIIGGGYNVHLYVIKTDSSGNSGCKEGNPFTFVSSTATQVASPAIVVGSPPFVITSPLAVVHSGGTATTLCTSVGINEITEENTFLISPNPSSDNFTISFGKTMTKGKVEILNTIGKYIFIENISNESEKEIKLKNISSGIYFVKVFDGEKSYCKKLIVE